MVPVTDLLQRWERISPNNCSRVLGGGGIFSLLSYVVEVEITLDVADSVPRKKRTYALLIKLKIETVTERRMTELERPNVE